ncbi:MAG TPA: hypothetical protein VGX21_21840 [Methylomirabilota bacterium]|jgi:hypothetical protein|nr:hypothetical protein [Methylomirabilota bacterium]
MMERLKQRDLRAVLEFLRGCYAIVDSPTLVGHVLRTLPAVIPADIVTWNSHDPRTMRHLWLDEPANATRIPGITDAANQDQYFARYMPQHPVLAHFRRTGSGAAAKISDFVSRQRFHRLALYNEVYRRVGTEYQLGTLLRFAPSPLLVLGLDRTRRDLPSAIGSS